MRLSYLTILQPAHSAPAYLSAKVDQLKHIVEQLGVLVGDAKAEAVHNSVHHHLVVSQDTFDLFRNTGQD